MSQINGQAPATGQWLREGGTVINLADLWAASMGQFGVEVVDDTAAHTPGTGEVFVALHCVTDTVFADVTAAADAPITGGTFAGLSAKAGFVFLGKVTSVTLTSGDVIAYRGLA